MEMEDTLLSNQFAAVVVDGFQISDGVKTVMLWSYTLPPTLSLLLTQQASIQIHCEMAQWNRLWNTPVNGPQERENT